MASSDLILWVYDATVGLVQADLDALPPGVAVTAVRNKIDLGSGPRYPQAQRPGELAISALTGEGLPALRRHVRGRAGLEGLDQGGFSARRRHLDALRRGLGHLETAAQTQGLGGAAELVALDLRCAQLALGEITGEVVPDDLLAIIFSTFCVGK
jgi:tRNA modification GTPase